MKRAYVAAFAFSLLSSNAFACEGWKSEYFKLAQKITAYGVTYRGYASGSFTQDKFDKKKDKHLSDIDELEGYVQSTSSCEGKEPRRERLLYWISTVKDAINANSDKADEIAKEIRDDFT